MNKSVKNDGSQGDGDGEPREGVEAMFIIKLFKCLALFLISGLILTIILYFTGAICLLFGIFNEYIFGCFLGVLHSIIIYLSGYKLINKIKISFKLYLFFTTFFPALLFNACYVFLRNWNITSSILETNISEIMYYFIFMSFAFSVASIAVTLIVLLRLLTSSRT